MNSISNIERLNSYIKAQSELDTLRFITCGSVDDGKSTLIGRMLYEAKLIFDDQISKLQSDSKKNRFKEEEIDFSLLVDGLSAEREQGITIDVAYRFFNTEKRKFIVADTPGHDQYTRNMVTGASSADLAIILVDATQGILPQTKRHSFIASLLGIKNIVLAINKMDLIEYSQDTFNKITNDFIALEKQLGFESIVPIPLSALKGDNVVERSDHTKWYQGPTLLGYLETIKINNDSEKDIFRLPVQWVNRPNSTFRGFAGNIVSGKVKKGDKIKALPSGQEASIDKIILYKGELDSAIAGQAVTVTLDKEIDISRGDLIVSSKTPCEVSDKFEAQIVWMDSESGYSGRDYLLKLGSNSINASLGEIKFKYDINNFEKLPGKELNLNDIACVQISLDSEIPFEPYDTSKLLGAFILVDKYTNSTVAAGMINFALRRASNIHKQILSVNRIEREKLAGHKGLVAWLTGISGAGKSTIASEAEKILHSKGLRTYILDGDNIRHGLSKDLGFTSADRVENIRRIAEVAKLMMDAGIIVLTAFISPFRAERDMARSLFKKEDFLEVFVDTPLSVAEERDPKGLYKKARRGDLPNFTGIDSAYEEPIKPDLILSTQKVNAKDTALKLTEMIEKKI